MDTVSGSLDTLIRKHTADDPQVIESMVREYQAQVYRLALSILCDPAEAEDATQETFLRAAASLRQYQVGTNFKAWIFTITVNTCRMILRKRAARARLQRLWEGVQSLVPRPLDPEAATILQETRLQLWDLVAGLGEKHRLVLVLHLAHNLTIAEIAQITHTNKKTVYTRLYAAIGKLRGRLEDLPEFNRKLDERR